MHHVVVHAHCYQPPRENPWLEVIESEPSATPDHNWNARIDRECYARLARAEVRRRDPASSPRDPDARTGLARLVNLYAWCTFDVGATLCEWMGSDAPETLRAMIDGDAASVKRWGHGNAIAAPYHHVILPLASPRDRRTEVRWGIADFQRRFGRAPEGFWLPECAADEDTLDCIAQEGIQFTILAPYQVRTNAETHGLPVRWRGASGRSLAILPYDGGLAGEVAFGGLLRDAHALSRRLAPTIDDGQARCTTLATDGETFGHHHRNGDRTLADAMARIAQRDDAQLTNAATMVARFPATLEAQLVSPSSWSCAHGIERWRSNCGCRIDQSKPAAQEWRGPLRVVLEALAEESAGAYERESTALVNTDPWQLRDAYGAIVAHEGESLEQFARMAAIHPSNQAQVARIRELLELQRATLRMFTSCAWFFDEVDRIEVRQVLGYAARVLELLHATPKLEAGFIRALESAHASAPGSATASDVFVQSALPQRSATWNVAAGAIALAAAGIPVSSIAVFDVTVTHDNDVSLRWNASLHHRRTGANVSMRGVVHGSGPSTRVTVATDHETRDIAVYDMPEAVAAQLLARTALSDRALNDSL